MSTSVIYQYMITGLNVFILILLFRSFIKHIKARKEDNNFNSRMMLVCILLILANTFALITGFYSYFYYHLILPEAVNVGRFADRYAMTFAYIAFNKLDRRD